MGLRDTLSTEENYKDGLISNREALLYFQEKLRKLQSDLESGIENYKKPTIEVYKSTLATILSYQTDILLATYSSGASLSAFKKEYISFVSFLIPIWRKEWGYEQMLWALSIGILLEIDEEIFDQPRYLTFLPNRHYLFRVSLLLSPMAAEVSLLKSLQSSQLFSNHS